jgi:hypothetical protein
MSSSLILASMKNNIIDPNAMFELGKRMKGDYRISVGDDTKNTAARNVLNQSISLTNKKRACCMGQKTVDVRIPLPIGTVPDKSAIGLLSEKYGFYDKLIQGIGIDKPGYCTLAGKNYSKNSPNCDDFYNLYCKNIVNEFKAGNNGKFDSVKFSTHYKPECACFIPTPKWLAQATGSEPVPKCMFPGCGTNQNVYLDPASRSTPSCDYTICSQQLNIDSATLAQDASFAANFQNTCGKEAGKDPLKQKPSTQPTTTVTSTEETSTGPITISDPVTPPVTMAPPITTTPTTGTENNTSTTGTGSNTPQTSGKSEEEQSSQMPVILGGGGLSSCLSSCICFIILALLIFAMTR